MFTVEFADISLDTLETDPNFTGGWQPAVRRGFRKVMQIIRAAVDERDLYKMKSLRFEKLHGARSHQRSLRINDKWRLIVEITGDAPNKTITIVEIVDYH